MFGFHRYQPQLQRDPSGLVPVFYVFYQYTPDQKLKQGLNEEAQGSSFRLSF